MKGYTPDDRLALDPGWPPMRPEPSPGDHCVSGAEPHRQIERLRVRHHERRGQRLDLGEGKALDVAPRRRSSAQRVARGGAHQRRNATAASASAPAAAQPHWRCRASRHGVGEIAILHRLRRLRDRGLHQPLAAARGALIHAGQFHDAEQLVARRGKVRRSSRATSSSRRCRQTQRCHFSGRPRPSVAAPASEESAGAPSRASRRSGPARRRADRRARGRRARRESPPPA